VPILSPPPLPVERFEEFKHFALTLDPAGWVNATGIALSIQHMLGIVIVGLDAEEEALQKWAANFGTDHWREDSERAQRAAEQPLPYAFSFGFGLPLQGWDQAAWAVPPGKILELNSWLRWALSEFYAAHRQTPDAVSPASTQSTAIEPTQPAPAAKRKRPKLDPLIAAIRKNLPTDKSQAVDQLQAVKKEALFTSYSSYCKSPDTCWRARKELLRELKLDP
jgi:hypothetical protein